MSDESTNGPIDPSEPPAGGPDPSLPPTEPIPTTEPLPPTEVLPVTPVAGDPVTPGALAAQQAAAQTHWYDNRAALGAAVAGGLLVLFLFLAWLLWWSDDDEGKGADSSTTVSLVTASTLADSTTSTSTIAPATIVEGERIDVTLPETSAPTTVPETTAPPTTAPPTTAPATTAAPTTVAATTTVATTTTTVPVVTVPPSPAATVMDILDASPDLSRVRQLVIDAGLADELAAEGPLTLFAPSNPAIETLEAAPGGAELLADPERLEQLLLHHVVPEALTADGVFAVTELTTLAGDTLVVDAAARTVGDAMLLVTDVEGANGVIHVVDAVLLQPS